MQERPFASLSIEDLAATAGLPRPAFYFYFSSKDDVLLALLDRVITEADARFASLPSDFTPDPAAAWRRVIGTYVEVFTSHRAVAVATLGARLHNPQIDELWTSSMSAWVGFTSEAIEGERMRGAAPPGVDARDIAIAPRHPVRVSGHATVMRPDPERVVTPSGVTISAVVPAGMTASR